MAPKRCYSLTNAINDPLLNRASPMMTSVYDSYTLGHFKAPVRLVMK